jgi:predicted metal-dependent hydrolase
MGDSSRIVFLMEMEVVATWQEGVDEYNAGRFWEAHERWERGWKELPEPMRGWVQAWIQIAGSHHLKAKGRTRPAHRLAERAQVLIEARAGRMRGVFPRIEIEGWESGAPGKAKLLLSASL